MTKYNTQNLARGGNFASQKTTKPARDTSVTVSVTQAVNIYADKQNRFIRLWHPHQSSGAKTKWATGQKLRMREPFKLAMVDAAGGVILVDGKTVEPESTPAERHSRVAVLYAADADRAELQFWRPATQLPRWASRTVLLVVRAAVTSLHNLLHPTDAWTGEAMTPEELHSFRITWDIKHHSKPNACWASNPLVWVIDFEILETSRVLPGNANLVEPTGLS